MKKFRKCFYIILILFLLVGCSREPIDREDISNIRDMTDEMVREVIEKSKNEEKHPELTKEEYKVLLDDALEAIEYNIPILENHKNELEINREEIINNLDFKRMDSRWNNLRGYKGTKLDEYLQEEYIPTNYEPSIRGLRYKNKGLCLALPLSYPVYESTIEKQKEYDNAYYENKKEQIRQGHMDMEEEFQSNINSINRNIEEMKNYREILIDGYEYYDVSDINLYDIEKDVITDVLNRNTNNIKLLDKIIKNVKLDGNLKSIYKEKSSFDSLENITIPEELTANNITASLESSIIYGKELIDYKDKVKHYDSPPLFYGLIDAPVEYYNNRGSLLKDSVYMMIDIKVRLEEYNKVLKEALKGKIYPINNDYFGRTREFYF